MLWPTLHLCRNPGLLQLGRQLIHKTVDETFALCATLHHLFCYALVLLRMLVTECQVFQFPLQLPDTESVSQGRVNQHGLSGQGSPQLDVITGTAQQYQFPGEIDQDDAHIFHQRQ